MITYKRFTTIGQKLTNYMHTLRKNNQTNAILRTQFTKAQSSTRDEILSMCFFTFLDNWSQKVVQKM